MKYSYLLVNSLVIDFPLSVFSPPCRKSSMVLWFEPDHLWPASTKVSLSISFLYSWTDLTKHKFEYLFSTFVWVPANSFCVPFSGFPNFYCPLELYAPKCGHFPKKSLPKINFKIVPRAHHYSFSLKRWRNIWEVHWNLKRPKEK